MTTTDSHRSVAAVVSYIILTELAIVLGMVFAIAWAGKTVEPEVLGLMGASFTAVFGLANLAAGFWLGASIGGRKVDENTARVQDALVSGVLQQAGVGPPPPNPPETPPLTDQPRDHA